jgi:polyhydroxybutyrate depolymerase
VLTDAGTDAMTDAGTDAVTLPVICASRPGDRGTRVLSLTSGNLLRTAILHVPPDYDPTRGTMLVLNFHGFSSDAPQQALLSRMSALADRRNFIVAYPYGVAASWNAGQCCGTAWSDAVDDVAFVRSLVALISSEYCVDPRRVFATGMSNGGFLSYRLGCEASDLIAAIAPVAGSLGIPPTTCNPQRAVPLFAVHGTADPIVRYDGGFPILPLNTSGTLNFRAVADSVGHFRAHNHCGTPSSQTYRNGDATCETWPGCDPNGEVSLCTIDQGGHTWPGGLPIPLVGKTSTDLDASEAIVDFFDRHPMPVR